jgi:hypothetical protein
MTNHKISFEFIKYEESDFSELVDLYNLCFNKSIELSYFSWKFINNPAGRARGFVAKHDGNIAGFYGIIPEKYLVGGKSKIIYQSMDTMTHPKYQRMGLFTKLANLTYQDLINETGEAFIVGFPGLTSYPGFVGKLGWIDIQQIKFLFLNKFAFLILTFFEKTEQLKALDFVGFDNLFLNFFNQKEDSQKPIQQTHSLSFLNWRCFTKFTPEFRGVYFTKNNIVLGYVIYRFEDDKKCFIQFVDSLRNDLYGLIISNFCRYIFSVKNVKFVFCFTPTDPHLQTGYKNNCFLYNPFKKGPFSYRPPLIVYSNKETIDGISFKHYENFNIQGIVRDY